MISHSYLVEGLNALSRAQVTDYFCDGHRGAAILSAYYLCAENETDAGVSELIAGIVDDHWSGTALCAPFPEEAADPALLSQVEEALAASIGDLRQVGHNVIFASLALKAFRQLPEAITPSRVAGVCRLIEAFAETTDIALEEQDAFPSPDTCEDVAEFALREYVRTARAFIGRGQGWTGHMLTFGRALVDLHQLGYRDLAVSGHHAFRQYVKRTRMGPQDTDRPRPEHAPNGLGPRTRAYWERRRAADPSLGHNLKYPYGYYGLTAIARDPALLRQCASEAFRVL